MKKIIYYWEWDSEWDTGLTEVKILNERQYKQFKKDLKDKKERHGLVVIDSFNKKPDKPVLYIIRKDGNKVSKYNIDNQNQLSFIIDLYKNEDFVDFVIFDKKGLSRIEKLHDEIFISENKHKRLVNKIYKLLIS